MLDVISGNVFYQVAALLMLAAVGGFAGLMLRQPLIVSFIAVGIPAGLTVAQIGEVSLILIAMGVTLGHGGNEALALVTLAGGRDRRNVR